VNEHGIDPSNRKYLEMQFDSLEFIEYIDTNRLMDQNCCSLLILGLLETGIQDSIFVNSIHKRAAQVVKEHFKQGRAIYILNPLKNEVDGDIPSTQNDSIKTVILDFGNWDFATLSFLEGIDYVNQTTRDLMKN
jgi:hypothetical protein